MNRLIAVLLGEITDPRQGARYNHVARQLVQPLLQDCQKSIDILNDLSDAHMSETYLKLCFSLLEKAQGREGGDNVHSGQFEEAFQDQVQSNVAFLLHLSLNCYTLLDGPNWYLAFELGPYGWHTPKQFDLLVDYHAHICDSKGANFSLKAILNTFVVLAGLHGSPSTPERQRHYAETTIQFMDPGMIYRVRMDPGIRRQIRYAALNAAFSIRTVIAVMGREDETLREEFSRALSSAVLGLQRTITPVYENTFNTPFFRETSRNLCYLQFLCTLVQEPAWRDQLYKTGHFDICLGIVDALSTRRGDEFGAYVVYITHIIASVDAVGEENSILSMGIQGYPIWPLILQAWHFIFSLDFFESASEENLMLLSKTGFLEALPSLVAYARRRWNTTETDRLLALVEEVCKKLDEEKQRAKAEKRQSKQDEESKPGEEKHQSKADQECEPGEEKQQSKADEEQQQSKPGEEKQQSKPDVALFVEDDNTFGHRGIPALGKELRELMGTFQGT